MALSHFHILFLAMLTLLSVLFSVGTGILIFVLVFFALSIQRVHIKVFDDILLHQSFKKALF